MSLGQTRCGAVALLGSLGLVLGCDGTLRLGGARDAQGDGDPQADDGGAQDGEAADTGVGPTTPCVNGKCPVSTMVCAAGVCVECNLDVDCLSASRPRCDVAQHRCVECGTASDCKEPAESVCEPQVRACIHKCSNAIECVADGYASCDTLRGYCVTCATSAQCTSGNKRTCDTRIGACVECLKDGDCTFDANARKCDLVTSRCAHCVDNRDCGPSAPICDISTRSCVKP